MVRRGRISVPRKQSGVWLSVELMDSLDATAKATNRGFSHTMEDHMRLAQDVIQRPFRTALRVWWYNIR